MQREALAEQEETPLQRRLEQLGHTLLWLSLGIVGVVFLLGTLRGEPLITMFLTAVSLAVAAIPEGLPAVVTITLALGVTRMVQRNALIRRLPAVETLGSTTVICSDKTGTLTKNEMTVTRVFAGNHVFEITGEGYEPVGEIRGISPVLRVLSPELSDQGGNSAPQSSALGTSLGAARDPDFGELSSTGSGPEHVEGSRAVPVPLLMG
jgi:Ca2+-transporting ATPase